RVEPGDVLKVEKLAGEAGSTLTFDDVLLVGEGAAQTIGKPAVDGAAVSATVLEQVRGEKVLILKKRRRKHYRRRGGHRQDLTVVHIAEIADGAGNRSAAPARVAGAAAPAAAAESEE
ncbi:MAG: 50S ribosomal protein L21, partial [Alphaproteobacteria bacterium]|nr:50S ribosomal protein L21 [Alphaproteobacteria bacterium]